MDTLILMCCRLFPMIRTLSHLFMFNLSVACDVIAGNGNTAQHTNENRRDSL